MEESREREERSGSWQDNEEEMVFHKRSLSIPPIVDAGPSPSVEAPAEEEGERGEKDAIVSGQDTIG